MSKHKGSSLDDLLSAEGILGNAQNMAIKEVVAWQTSQKKKTENIIHTRRTPDGKFARVLPNGTTQPLSSSKTDWSRLDAMTEAETHAAAMSDPDAQPMTDNDFKKMKRTPQVKVIRRALGLTQEDFAQKFHIPIGTLRDWEQARKIPDATAKAYLTVIATRPNVVSDALEKRPQP